MTLGLTQKTDGYIMQYLLLIALFITACANRSHVSKSEAPTEYPGAIELSKALEQGASVTMRELRSLTSAQPYEVSNLSNPFEHIPSELKSERITKASTEKSQQIHFIRTFKNWSVTKKIQHAKSLAENFECSKALESQAMGFALEVDFPENEPREMSLALHEKVLSCEIPSKNDSYLRLAIFSIQKEDCSKALTYLNTFSEKEERGLLDRVAYLKTFCDKNVTVTKRNPLGGYGILLHQESPEAQEFPIWKLGAHSGVEEWDRFLVTLMDLTEKGQSSTVKYFSGKMNYEKFKTLPLSFQASVLTVFSYNGADLSVFQYLHQYLSDNPEMMTPALAGLLFPVRFWKEIIENSKSVDPVLVKSLIRQESAFNPAAKSRVRASGLMQLMHSTAKMFGVNQPKQLLMPEKNIQAGSEFLAQLIRDFESVELALAAYNAGPGIVRQWQKRYPTSNIDLFVEMIPYSETRQYVRLIKRNYKIYQSLLTQPQVLGKFQYNPKAQEEK